MNIEPLAKNLGIIQPQAGQQQSQALIHTLPTEILLQIFSALEVKDLANARLACKAWKVLSQDPCLWKAIAKRLQWKLEVSLAPYEQMLKFLHTQWLAEKKHHPKALEKMGFWYLDGTRGEKDEEIALIYLEKTGRLGLIRSLNYFKHIAEREDRVDCIKRLEHTKNLILDATCFGSDFADSYVSLGKICLENLYSFEDSDVSFILKKSYEKAHDYLKLAAKFGHPEAQKYFQPKIGKEISFNKELAFQLKNLSTVNKEMFSTAVSYYESLCEHPIYQILGNYYLGKLYYNAKGPFFKGVSPEQSGQKAVAYLLRASSEHVVDWEDYKKYHTQLGLWQDQENLECQNKFELMNYEWLYQRDQHKDYMNFITSIQLQCRFMLGRLYFAGRGVAQSYEVAARIWEYPDMWDKSCSKLYPYDPVAGVFVCLGELYENGWGIEQSYEKAFALYKRFVKDLYNPFSSFCRKYIVKALGRLGYLYQNGLGTAKDDKKAQECFRKIKEVQEEIQKMKRGLLGELTREVLKSRKRKRNKESCGKEPPSKRTCLQQSNPADVTFSPNSDPNKL